MCVICNNNSKILRMGSYDKCKYCGTCIANIIPSQKKIQRVLEEHAGLYILDTQKMFDLSTYTTRLAALQKYAKSAKTVLDFGCGNGNFVKFLRSKKYKTFGYDKSVGITEHLFSEKLPFYKNENEIPNEYFNVITCFDVIEHATNPEKIMDVFRMKLKKGGILILSTPNAESISSKVLGKNWWVFGPEAHFIIFSLFSLKLFLYNHNFNILDSATDILTSWFVPSEKLLSRIGNKVVYLVLFPFKSFLFASGYGDNIQIVAKVI